MKTNFTRVWDFDTVERFDWFVKESVRSDSPKMPLHKFLNQYGLVSLWTCLLYYYVEGRFVDRDTSHLLRATLHGLSPDVFYEVNLRHFWRMFGTFDPNLKRKTIIHVEK